MSAHVPHMFNLFQEYVWNLGNQCGEMMEGQRLQQDSPSSTQNSEEDASQPCLQSLAAGTPKLASVTVVYEAPGKNKRGRKPLRPQDPVRRKTEEKDKYWLRAFRAFMHKRFIDEKKSMTLEDRFFWREYLGPEGKPDKGNPYLSYGQKYKDYLFSHSTFTFHFVSWFKEHGETTLETKYEKSSDLWFVYYDYALKELINYTVKGGKSE